MRINNNNNLYFEKPLAMWFRDIRVTAFLLGYSLIVTFLLFQSESEIKVNKELELVNIPLSCPYTWHGGSPTQSHPGSCWCGQDKYCLCTPSLAIDTIIEVVDDVSKSIVLVHRKEAPKNLFALPGGFVDVGESVESATKREVMEETNLELSALEQFHVYSDPKRDYRRHTVSSVFLCRAKDVLTLKTGDDAKSVELMPIETILYIKDMAFDHHIILSDYMKKYHNDLYITYTNSLKE
jgi:8-oxo-dGTP diphosphatase